MRRNPIDDHADAGLMRAIDEAGESLGQTETRCRCEQAQWLIPPGAAERMFGDRQELHMREAEVNDVGQQTFRQRIPIRRLSRRVAPPGRGLNLIDRDWRGDGLARGPRCHPIGVFPGVRQRMGDPRGGARGQLRFQRQRIRFQWQQTAVVIQQLVLIKFARTKPGNEQLPHTGFHTPAHRMTAAVPCVEVANHGHAAGVWRPYREPHAADAVDYHTLRAEHRPQLKMTALREEMHVERAEQRAEGVRILGFFRAARPDDAQSIACIAGDLADEKARRVAARQSGQQFSRCRNRFHAVRAGHEATQFRSVTAQYRERVTMAAMHHCFDRRVIQRSEWPARSWSASRRRLARSCQQPAGQSIEAAQGHLQPRRPVRELIADFVSDFFNQKDVHDVPLPLGVQPGVRRGLCDRVIGVEERRGGCPLPDVECGQPPFR